MRKIGFHVMWCPNGPQDYAYTHTHARARAQTNTPACTVNINIFEITQNLSYLFMKRIDGIFVFKLSVAMDTTNSTVLCQFE